ncbi:MAG: hypothetical protein WCP89_01885 [archaeon]
MTSTVPNSKLLEFIQEARKRGFTDIEIKEPLLKNNWPQEEIEKAFIYLQPKFKLKNQICIFLDEEVIKMLEKRAKKGMLTLPEQIEDILRRSCLGIKNKKLSYDSKLDDTLISLFSRKNTGKKKR